MDQGGPGCVGAARSEALTPGQEAERYGQQKKAFNRGVRKDTSDTNGGKQQPSKTWGAEAR